MVLIAVRLAVAGFAMIRLHGLTPKAHLFERALAEYDLSLPAGAVIRDRGIVHNNLPVGLTELHFTPTELETLFRNISAKGDCFGVKKLSERESAPWESDLIMDQYRFRLPKGSPPAERYIISLQNGLAFMELRRKIDGVSAMAVFYFLR